MSDSYQKITDQVLKLMDGGTAPWRMPWTTDAPRGFRTRRPYRGINRLLLSATTAAIGYRSPYWITFAQCKPVGLKIGKGQKGTPIVYWHVVDEDEQAKKTGAKRNDDAQPKPANGEAGDEDDKKKTSIPERRVFPRAYVVWNLEQTNLPELLASGEKELGKGGIPADAFGKQPGEGEAFVGIEAADYILDNMPNPPHINVGKQNGRAFYAPSEDTISVPSEASFERPSAFYATLFHEVGHSTGHPSRCARPGIMDIDHFGSDKYGREELVAEFTACFLAAEAGIAPLEIEDSAAYLRSWKKTIQADPRLVLIAAGQAQKAADYVMGRTATEADAETPEPTEPAQAA